MKRQIIKITTLVAIAIIPFTSCKKEEKSGSDSGKSRTTAKSDITTTDELLEKEGVDADKIVIEYYMDGIRSSKPTGDVSDYFPVYSATKSKEERSAVITINMFSNEERYLIYGDVNGLKFREEKAFEAEVVAEANSRGLDVESEDAGEELPEDFLAYVEEKHEEYFGRPETSRLAKTTFTGWFQGWDDIVPYGSTSVFPMPSHPRLWAWNNELGCVQGWSTYSIFHLWDKGFYRKKIGVINRWGFDYISFSSAFGLAHFNNKVTSYTHIAF
ncbi:MAG TPA: hypothetical protein VL092_02080 [Chitinophagaceae bacterium]|nr:hypothetical protein [Chitinophagaceae bacterium]